MCPFFCPHCPCCRRRPNVTPRTFAGAIAGGFQKACPDSYSEKIIKEGKNERGYEQFVGVVSCGASPGTNRVTSESAPPYPSCIMSK